MTRFELTALLRGRALQLGFSNFGVAKADRLHTEAVFLEQWLAEKRHGNMGYMERYFELRTDPRSLLPNAKSVIVLSYNYYTKQTQHTNAPKVAMYAFGKDYHHLIRRKLNELCAYIEEISGGHGTRSFVDSGPVMERAWAQRAGIGWQGKNTLLLTKQNGSYFFLATVITDLELVYGEPAKDYCGNCTKCIDACPTKAIHVPYQLDASRCISYLTIENKENELPTNFKHQMDDWIFGCDVCQQVCPINSQATEHQDPYLQPIVALLDLQWQDWQQLSEERFNEMFRHSPIKRPKYKGIMRNLRFLLRDPSNND